MSPSELGPQSDNGESKPLGEQKLELEVEKLDEQLRQLKRPFAQPSFWFSLSATVLAVIGVIGQGYLSSIKSERANLSVERAQQEVKKAESDLSAALNNLETAKEEKLKTQTQLDDLLANIQKAGIKLKSTMDAQAIADIETTFDDKRFNITLRFTGVVPPSQRALFKRAATRWEKIIVGDLPNMDLAGNAVDDILIDINGIDTTIAHAHELPIVRMMRPDSYLPVHSALDYNTNHLAHLEKAEMLENAAVRQIGLALGFATIWQLRGLIDDVDGDNPVFVGPNAVKEFKKLHKGSGHNGVPIENSGPSKLGAWRKAVFRNEAMTDLLSTGNKPISRMTIGAFEDIGYEVSYEAAESFTLASSAATPDR